MFKIRILKRVLSYDMIYDVERESHLYIDKIKKQREKDYVR